MNSPLIENRYDLKRLIATGGTAEVYLAFDTECKKPVAIKVFKVAEYFHKESQTLSILNKDQNSKIVHQLDVLQKIDYHPPGRSNAFPRRGSAIVLEYVERGEIFEYLAVKGSFPENIARHYFRELVEVISYLHGQGFAHRDIKPENLLLDESFNLKLADFGFARKCIGDGANGYIMSREGTAPYLPPQMALGKLFTAEQADLFAMGVILFIMVAGVPPFRNPSPHDSYYKHLIAKEYQTFWEMQQNLHPNAKFSDDFKDLINHMLAFQPQDRLPLEEIKKHPWMQGPLPAQGALQAEMKARFDLIEKQKESKKNSN